jgi:hypothetical protein
MVGSAVAIAELSMFCRKSGNATMSGTSLLWDAMMDAWKGSSMVAGTEPLPAAAKRLQFEINCRMIRAGQQTMETT